jgi:hypothetical protein
VEEGGPAALTALLRNARWGEPLARVLDLVVDITACGNAGHPTTVVAIVLH